MAMKDWLLRFQPLQLYIILILSIAYFFVQLFMSHITHALTLLVDVYHMLCNIIALSGCILTIKHCNKEKKTQNNSSVPTTSTTTSVEENQFVEICIKPRSNKDNHEHTLRNTFGWTRIDVLTMLIVCIFLASLSFSLLVEALQTLIHIGHQDTIHHPISILILGCTGLLLNGVCYLLIGGYTYHQGSFLHITSSGDVILDRVVSGQSLRHGERRLSKTKRTQESTINEIVKVGQQQVKPKRRQSFAEMFRDISSTLFLIICCFIVYFANNENVTKYVDPLMSIISCAVLLVTSYPYMKESCFILLQTIPGKIDIDQFKIDLMKSFSEIVSVHDLHIWQLTASKFVSTAHIIFQNPNVYAQIKDDVVNFFYGQGITIVTIQPEFKSTQLTSKLSGSKCLVECLDKDCIQKSCCANDTDDIQIELIVNNEATIQIDINKSVENIRETKSDVLVTSAKAKSMLCLNVSQLAELERSTAVELSTDAELTKNSEDFQNDEKSTVCKKTLTL